MRKWVTNYLDGAKWFAFASSITPMKQMARQRREEKGRGRRALSDGSRAPQTNFGRHRDTYRLSVQRGINGWTDVEDPFHLYPNGAQAQGTNEDFLSSSLFHSCSSLYLRLNAWFMVHCICVKLWLQLAARLCNCALIYVTTSYDNYISTHKMAAERTERTATPRFAKGEVRWMRGPDLARDTVCTEEWTKLFWF